MLLAITYSHALMASEVVGLTRDDADEQGIRIVGLKDGERVTQPLISRREGLLSERQSLLAFVAEMDGKQVVFGRKWALRGLDCF